MKQLPLYVSLSCLMWLVVAAAVDAQIPASKAEPSGWTSSWTQPANDEVRRRQTLTAQFEQLLDAGKFPEALAKSEEGIKAFPNDSRWYALRAQMLLKLNRLDAALRDIDQGMTLATAHKDTVDQSIFLNFRANANARTGNYALAVKDLQVALHLDPRDSMHANSLAWIRATCPQPEIRNGPEGVKLAKTALSLHPQHPYAVLDTMAAAYAEANDYPRALETEKQAITAAQKTLAKDVYLTTFLPGASKRLQLFERGQPYHHDTWGD